MPNTEVINIKPAHEEEFSSRGMIPLLIFLLTSEGTFVFKCVSEHAFTFHSNLMVGLTQHKYKKALLPTG